MKYKIPENAKILKINPDYGEKHGYNYLAGLYIKTDKGTLKFS